MNTLRKIYIMGKIKFLPFISGNLMLNPSPAVNSNPEHAIENTIPEIQNWSSGRYTAANDATYDSSPVDDILLNWDELSLLAIEGDGAKAVTDAINILKNVGLLMDKMSGMVTDLTRSTEDADKIIQATDKIAFQASLLALSAEMKAAQADGDGHEFAIVAHGARKLAMRAADIAKDTNNLIKETVKYFRIETEAHSFNPAGKNGLVFDKQASSLEQTKARDILSRALPMIDQATAPQPVNDAGKDSSAFHSEDASGQTDHVDAYIINRKLIVNGRNKRDNRRPFTS